MSERMVTANGVDICTEAFGVPTTPTLLLINGATSSMIRWEDDFCQRLADAGRHVIRYDNRDTGRSVSYDPGSPPYTLEDLADDAVGVLDAHGVARAHLVGVSMGGMICQLVARRNPERVITITPIMSTPEPAAVVSAADGEEGRDTLPGPTAPIVEFLSTFPTLDWTDEAAVVNFFVDMFRALNGSAHPFDDATAREICTRQFRRATNAASCANHGVAVANSARWRDRLGDIRVPTLVIHGSEDPILPYAHGVALAKEIPASTLMTMEGGGHTLPRPVWDTVIPAVLAHTEIS